MKAKSKISSYIIRSIAAAAVLLTAQFSLAGSATWLLSPQNSIWNNANNWTSGGPPNGPSDIATFAQSSRTGVTFSGWMFQCEVNSIVFTSDSASFDFTIDTAIMIISGTGITNNSSVSQQHFLVAQGAMAFNNASTAGSVSIATEGNTPYGGEGYLFFNDASSAAGASILNGSSGWIPGSGTGAYPGETIFNGTSAAGHATITNRGGGGYGNEGGRTIFTNSSTADSATLVAYAGDFGSRGGAVDFRDASSARNAIITAHGSSYESSGGAIRFHNSSTGGTARVEVFDNGYLDIRDHQSGVTVGSIAGSGDVFLGANNLTVGANDMDTAFSGVISNEGQGGSLAKLGSGVLTLQANDCIADTVGLILVSGSIIKLDFTGLPDVIASLVVNGVPQPPGIYGGPMSGAPNILAEFTGSGTVLVGVDLRYDFNNDGHPDFVLYNASTHRTAIWYLNNNVYLNSKFGLTLQPGWMLVDTANFPSDSHPDYVLRNPGTRGTAVWHLNNNVYVSSLFGPTLPSGWQLAATADFNSDAKPDYLLYNAATHKTQIWHLNNNVYVSGAYGPTLPGGWSLVSVADFNGDAKTDYLLFNATTRKSAIWYLNNNVYVSSVYGPTLPSGWQLSGAADFNADNHPDYVLFNAATNQTAIWYLNNNVYLSGRFGPTVPSGWSLVAP